MLEKIIELLLGLAVGAAGIVGISTAADAVADAQVHPAGTEAAAEKTAAAWRRADDVRRDVEHRLTTAADARTAADADADVAAALDPATAGAEGRATAAAAIEAAIELAPEAADVGLENALTRVTTAPPVDASDTGAGASAEVHAEVDVEAGAAAEVELP